MNFISKIFKSKSETSVDTKRIDIGYTGSEISIETIDISPNIYLACRGARTCVGRTVQTTGTIADRLSYISKIIGKGHESVLEHTNIIFLLKFSKKDKIESDFIELMSSMKYANVCFSEDDDHIYLLIGSSIRGLKHIILETKKDNIYIPAIREAIYATIEKEFLKSLINKDLLDEDRCTYLPDISITNADSDEEELQSTEIDYGVNEIKGKYADLIYNTKIADVYKKVKKYGFALTDVYKVSIISFFIHDISRSCANQLTRHRNGISQESQRYVTHQYDMARDFINPIEMNWETRYKDKLDETALKKIKEMDVFKNYKYLISAAAYKEDARAWLPMNVTTKLMMTFTYEHFAKFLELRLDKAAQLEIRRLAEEMKSYEFTEITFQDFMDLALKGKNDILSIEEKVDEEEFVQTETDVEDIKPMHIDSLEDAEKMINNAEKMKGL